MSNVIDFLERIGQDANLRNAPDAALERALAEAQIDPAVREAILLRDQRRLESLLGATTNVCCVIYSPVREDEEETDEPLPDQGGEEEEEKAVRLRAG
jgi:hypothetical protein